MSPDWNATYASKSRDERSWSQHVPDESLAAINRAHLAPDDPLIDIGGGASTLVDALIQRGHTDVTVLDVADTALWGSTQPFTWVELGHRQIPQGV